MTAVDRGPATTSRWLSAFAGLLALVTGGFYSWIGLAVGAVGLVVLVGGLARGTNRYVSSGAFGLFLAAVVAGTQGAPVPSVLAGVVLSVVAWDVGGNALGLGRQLGRDAKTRRIELLHAAASLTVGVVTASIGYGVYWFSAGGQPAGAVVLLVLGAVLLVATLD